MIRSKMRYLETNTKTLFACISQNTKITLFWGTDNSFKCCYKCSPSNE